MYINDKKNNFLKDIYVLFYVNYYSGNKMDKTMALNWCKLLMMIDRVTTSVFLLVVETFEHLT